MLGGQVVSAGVMIGGADGCDFFDSGNDCNLVFAGAIGFVGFWVWSWIDAPLSARSINRRIDAGQVALEIGPQLFAPNGDSRVGLRLVRMRF